MQWPAAVPELPSVMPSHDWKWRRSRRLSQQVRLAESEIPCGRPFRCSECLRVAIRCGLQHECEVFDLSSENQDIPVQPCPGACGQSSRYSGFPFNQRWLMGPWSFFFNENVRFQPNAAQSPEWNRGAYLAEALAHCGECHTPRNLAFALNNCKKFAGAVTAGWHASISAPTGARGRCQE